MESEEDVCEFCVLGNEPGIWRGMSRLAVGEAEDVDGESGVDGEDVVEAVAPGGGGEGCPAGDGVVDAGDGKAGVPAVGVTGEAGDGGDVTGIRAMGIWVDVDPCEGVS